MLFLHALQSYTQKHMLAQSDPKQPVTKYILNIYCVYKLYINLIIDMLI